MRSLRWPSSLLALLFGCSTSLTPNSPDNDEAPAPGAPADTTPFQPKTPHQWGWTLPQPQGHALLTIFSLGETLYAAGEKGAILTSNDNGKSWDTPQSPAFDRLNDIWASAPDNVYIAGSASRLLHSSDGKTWRNLFSDKIGQNPFKIYGDFFGIWGSSADDLYMVGNLGQLVRSTDGGKTWSATKLSDNTATVFYSVWGSSATDVFIVGSAGTILHSSDQGKTWTPQASNTKHTLYRVWGGSSKDIYAVGDAGTILHTTDGGKTWTTQASNTQATLYNIWGREKDGAFTIYAVGDNALLRTQNAGAAWTTLATPRTNTLRDVVSDGEQLIAVGSPLMGLFSEDDGGSFRPLAKGAPADFWIQDLFGEKGGALYAVGSGGILQSSDRGKSFRVAGNTENLSLRGVFGASPGTLIAVGGDVQSFAHDLGTRGQDICTIVRTEDAGGNWQQVPCEGKEQLNGVWANGPNDIYAVGVRGTILHSKDSGKTWKRQESGTQENLVAVFGDSKGNVYAVGGGAVLQTSNRGKRWKALSGANEAFAKMADKGGFLDVWASDKEVYIVGWGGAIIRSDDQGESWKTPSQFAAPPNKWTDLTDLVTNSTLHAVWGFPGQGGPAVVFMAGDGGTLISTKDGGQTWEKEWLLHDSFTALWGSGAEGLYAAGSQSILSLRQ